MPVGPDTRSTHPNIGPFARNGRRVFSATFANSGRRLFWIALGAGLLGGAIGAAYIGLLHLFARGLWPTHSGLLVHGIALVAVGVVVAVLTRTLGSPGDG
jgi:hypothetical protein